MPSPRRPAPASTFLEEAIGQAHELLDRDQAEPALELLTRALGALDDGTSTGSLRGEAHGLAGVAARALGAISIARDHFTEGERLLAEVGDPAAHLALAAMLEDRAELELDARSPDSARAALRRALGVLDRAGVPARGESWLALADCELRCGEPEAACAALARALDRALAPELALDPRDCATALELEGDALLASGDSDPDRVARADASYAASERAFRADGDLVGAARSLLGRAHAAERRGDAAALAAHAAAIRALPIDGTERAAIEAELESIE